MLKSLQLLQDLDIEKLEKIYVDIVERFVKTKKSADKEYGQIKANFAEKMGLLQPSVDTCPKVVIDFCNQLKDDFSQINSNGKLLNTSLNSLFFIIEKNKELVETAPLIGPASKDTLRKLELLSIILKQFKDSDKHKVDNLSENITALSDAITTFQSSKPEKTATSKFWLNPIISALDKKSIDPTIWHDYYRLGSLVQFIQKQFPNITIEKIQNDLDPDKHWQKFPLPRLQTHLEILCALPVVSVEMKLVDNKDEIILCEGLSNGIKLFSALMGDKRINDDMKVLHVDENNISQLKNYIDELTYKHRLNELEKVLNSFMWFCRIKENLKHGDDAKRMRYKLKEIMSAPPPHSNKQKFDEIIEHLAAIFDRKNEEYDLPSLFEKHTAAKPKQDFISYLNHPKQNYRHYTRMIGLIVNDAITLRYADNPDAAPKKLKDMKRVLDKLETPETEDYQRIRLNYINTSPSPAALVKKKL